MNRSYAEVDGKPVTVTPAHVNLGIAIDLARPDGSRTLVVPSIKAAETMDFRQFWQAYEDVVRRARRNELTMDDYTGTHDLADQPGRASAPCTRMPRLMHRPGHDHRGRRHGVPGRRTPGMSDEPLADLAISKIITLTSTYDHRIIQGAQSGEFLRTHPPAAAR